MDYQKQVAILKQFDEFLRHKPKLARLFRELDLFTGTVSPSGKVILAEIYMRAFLDGMERAYVLGDSKDDEVDGEYIEALEEYTMLFNLAKNIFPEFRQPNIRTAHDSTQ